MHNIDTRTFRRILETALARGDVRTPFMVELVTSYLVTGVARSMDESCDSYYDVNDPETDIDSVLFGLETQSDSTWILVAFNHLLETYTQTHDPL